ncbi:MAG: ATP-binding cassette domain-containing protein [Lentisphaeria bacterium]|nr:ATP-binding cassette domain-containing protein [Lentisphaeria bacterium]
MRQDSSKSVLSLRDLTIGYDGRIVMENINFDVKKGEIISILGQSGCGKSTLLKNIIGLYEPLKGSIEILGRNLNECSEARRRVMMKKMGITYQSGALLGSLTIAENVALPLEEHTRKSAGEIQKIATEKLTLVGMEKFADYMPSEISGGMKKRAGLARALALDPELLFFDEPSAGLDPISSAEFDTLIKNIRNKSNATVVLVTHELDSIFSISDRVVVLDKTIKTIADIGNPYDLRINSKSEFVRRLLGRNNLKRQE